MGTRAAVKFTDLTKSVTVYKQYDGNPDGKHGVVSNLSSVWKTCRDHKTWTADYASDQFVQFLKEHGYEPSYMAEHLARSITDYFYEVECGQMMKLIILGPEKYFYQGSLSHAAKRF